MTAAFFDILFLLLNVLFYIIIAQVILSWLFVFGVINPSSSFVRGLVDALDRITGPLYRPIRKIMPDFGGIDLSPMVLIILIMILQRVLAGVAMELGPTVFS
ncbi:YggT family protein [Sphingomicrobium marinum]|uniref:YggT family protein n=1 Tax=Sphingomicrobium marinum TaxID=1227950 RepID=UPI002240B881|nr:YggT family protein [Sphingomicrobium marinum]